jgi:hypothetical protein
MRECALSSHPLQVVDLQGDLQSDIRTICGAGGPITSLTLPSRGRFPACGLQAPLMSNVSPHMERSRSTAEQFDRFFPVVGDAGKPVEPRETYFARMRAVLPNVPTEVLGQWLYEHWSDVGRYDWLDFPTLQFNRETWTTTQILESGIDQHPLIGLYKRHFEEGVKVKRSSRIASFMRTHRTWPVPPILVANEHSRLKWPDGAPFLSPFHPIEGQHRIAVFLSFAHSGRVAPTHVVWRIVASAGSQVTPSK